MPTEVELEVAYKRGFKAGPDAINPYQHYHPALRQQWDDGQNAAFVQSITEPSPATVAVLRYALYCLLAVLAVGGAYSSLQ